MWWPHTDHVAAFNIDRTFKVCFRAVGKLSHEMRFEVEVTNDILIGELFGKHVSNACSDWSKAVFGSGHPNTEIIKFLNNQYSSYFLNF